MHRQQRNAARRPPTEVNPRETSGAIVAGHCALPAWNRERLIQQFRDIDGSTRGDAEAQIDAYERSFSDGFAATRGARNAGDRSEE
jgi:hypothetical protein